MDPSATHRRLFLAAGAAAFVAAPACARAGRGSLRQAACDLALYALPVLEMAGTRGRAFRAGVAANHFRHVRDLTTAATQKVTQPNNDTLYSSAWLDLSAGPARITLPQTGERYMSLALMDMFTNNFAVLRGGAAREVLIVGPGAPETPAAIRAPTDWVWALGRTLVRSPDDLPQVHAIQNGLIAEGPSHRLPVSAPPSYAHWTDVFDGVTRLLADTPPPAQDQRWLARAAAGLIEGGRFDPARFTAREGDEIAAGLAEALEIARRGDEAGERRDGWLYPRPNLGRFGADFRYRAQIALSGLAALPVDEALYLRALAPDGGSEIDSRRPWTLKLPLAARPPVEGFWSLTIYEVAPSGQAFLIDNPLQRYAIGDRTPGLADASGDIEILISADAPPPTAQGYWLPAPTSGRPFLLSFRAYRPAAAMSKGLYRLPALEPA